MQIEHSEYVKLQSQLQDHFDGRYVKLDDKDNVRLAVIEHQQRINNWLTSAIAGGIVALVIKVFLGS